MDLDGGGRRWPGVGVLQLVPVDARCGSSLVLYVCVCLDMGVILQSFMIVGRLWGGLYRSGWPS